MKKITLRDVASMAGVAPSTASYAVNDKYVTGINIPEPKREAIKAVAKKLGYKADDMARAISTGKARVIGFACLNPADSDYFAPMIAHIMDSASCQGYLIKLLFIDDSDAERFVSTCVDQRLSGVILYALPERLLRKLASLLRKEDIVPAVIGNALAPDECIHVVNDDEVGCALMIQYLHELGHRRIAYVGNVYLASDIRELGYRSAMREVGLDVPSDCVLRSNDCHEVERLVLKLIDEGESPDAFFCSSDNIASTIITALLRRGVRVPEDVSVAGFGNLSCSKFVIPNITTVDESHKEVARGVVGEILQTIDSKESVHLKKKIPPSIMKRQSVARRS